MSGIIIVRVSGDGVAEPNAHGSVSAGIEAETGLPDGENAARNIHRVCAFGDIEDIVVRGRGELGQSHLDNVKYAMIGYRCFVYLGSLRGFDFVLFCAALERVVKGGIRGVSSIFESDTEF